MNAVHVGDGPALKRGSECRTQGSQSVGNVVSSV